MHVGHIQPTAGAFEAVRQGQQALQPPSSILESTAESLSAAQHQLLASMNLSQPETATHSTPPLTEEPNHPSSATGSCHRRQSRNTVEIHRIRQRIPPAGRPKQQDRAHGRKQTPLYLPLRIHSLILQIDDIKGAVKAEDDINEMTYDSFLPLNLTLYIHRQAPPQRRHREPDKVASSTDPFVDNETRRAAERFHLKSKACGRAKR
ncbi:hypothetical protein MMC13_002488 [Lambiella insularis]|nr:hypothetical protein [Lambiella insularis]